LINVNKWAYDVDKTGSGKYSVGNGYYQYYDMGKGCPYVHMEFFITGK
jgi:hypothetical protein